MKSRLHPVGVSKTCLCRRRSVGSVPDRNPQTNSHLTKLAFPWAPKFELCTTIVFPSIRPGRDSRKGCQPEYRQQNVDDGERIWIGKSLCTIEDGDGRKVDKAGCREEALI